MKITYTKGRGNKIHISADGEYRATVDADFWFSCPYTSGDDITEQELEKLCRDIENRRVFNKAVDYLSRRDHSAGELIDKLSRTAERSLCREVVDGLIERGYVDDERFAQNYARYLSEVKHFGKNRVKDELFRKKIASDIINSVIDSLYYNADPVADITTLLQTKFSNKLETEKDVRRTVNALVRMGYGYSDIKSALESFKDSFDD